ncbi:MAG: glycosyltransferase family 39 protein, partial [Planctomycetota bacterium]
LLFSSCAPVLIATRFLANPDPPLCLFYLATMAALWRARDGKLGWWIAAGVFTGCALLSKYTAAFLGLSGVIVLLFDAPMRRQLLRPGPWLAVVTAALVFLPVVLWNVDNDFESFRFQTSSRFGNARWSLASFVRFVVVQFGLLHPAVALMLPVTTAWLVRRAMARDGERDPRALWLLAFGLPMPLFFLTNAMWMQVKPNWIAPAYLPLLLGIAWWWSESGLELRRPKLALAARRTALATIPLFALAPLISLWPQHRGSSWTGWTEIAACAEKWEERIDPEDHTEGNVFFFAADYKDAAQLTHGLRLHEQSHPAEPPVEAVLAQNALGRSALQFDHWDAPSKHVGQDAIFVLPRADQRKVLVDEMRARFASAELVEHVRVDRLGIQVMSADIFVCRNYKGAQ